MIFWMRCRWSLLLGHCSFSSILLGTTFLVFCLIKCSGLSHSIACNHSFTCWCITLPWETLYVPMTNNYGNTEFSGATNGIPTEIREYAAAKIRPPRCLYCPQSWVVMMDKSLFFRDLCIFCRDAYTPSCGNYINYCCIKPETTLPRYVAVLGYIFHYGLLIDQWICLLCSMHVKSSNL